MLVGVNEQAKPVGDVDAVRDTVPEHAFKPTTVIVEEPGAPARTVTEVGLAAIA